MTLFMFHIAQLDAVVKELYNRSGEKWPLVVLHNRRFRALVENPSHRKVVEEWVDKGILYATPSGSNDDWYEPAILYFLKLYYLFPTSVV